MNAVQVVFPEEPEDHTETEQFLFSRSYFKVILPRGQYLPSASFLITFDAKSKEEVLT